MQRRHYSRFNIYVLCIAYSQTVDLIINALLDDFLGRGLHWISDCTIRIKLDTWSSFSCKFFSYVPKTTSFLSNGLLVVFSIDRLLTAINPIKFRGDQFLYPAKWCMFIMLLLSLTLFIPQLIHYDLVFEGSNDFLISKTLCNFVDSLKWPVQFVLWIAIVGTHTLPAMFITGCNVFILIKLRGISQRRYRLGVTKQHSVGEMRRIMGHLSLTTIFLFLTIPLVVVIILRQQSDRQNYRLYHPAYAKQVEDLSRLFSSFDAVSYSTQFPIFLAFLPNFRQTLVRIWCNNRLLRDTSCAQSCLRSTTVEGSARPTSTRRGSFLMTRFMKVMATGTTRNNTSTPRLPCNQRPVYLLQLPYDYDQGL
ncbi:uncharacterized protein DEA37_0011890 [Paragonimus westermani]|uniref:G-protein coupled receptors family 1 profile domain-containing protein n=1 Tax=Paragonimus westermani TaxID=34504 RepID=A0A5J4NDZ4_9TREM|nr:uncharacterized protein DEA37_0011890 [Paragonimus westermani]